MSARDGTWIVAAVLLLWGWAAATSPGAWAGEASAPPPGTVPSEGFPPYVPDDADDAPAVRAWCDACAEAARTHEDGPLAGDLLYAAAFALHRRLGAAPEALALYEEAAARYPPTAPGAGLAHLQSAHLHLRAGNLPAADRALDAARRIGHVPSPLDATPREASHWEALQEQLAWTAPRIGADVAEALGDLGRAAREAEALARAADVAGKGDRWAASRYAHAARLRARADEKEAALVHVERALALARDEDQRAQYAFWRLYLQYGMLGERGEARLVGAWPGEAFVRDAHGVLRDLEGNAHVGQHVLSLASRAWTTGHDEAALEFYEMALADPVLCEQARTDPTVARGLLVAFPVALRLGHLDRAEAILETVAGLANLERGEIAGYRLAIIRAREEVAETASATEAPDAGSTLETGGAEARPAPNEAEEPPDPSPHRGLLRPETPDAPAGRTRDEVETVRRGIGEAVVATAVLAVILLVLVGLVRKGLRK